MIIKSSTAFVARIAVLAALVAVAAPRALAAEKAAAPAAPVPTPAPKPTLIFFLNPAGRPCQMQDQILSDSRVRWEPLATLRYARTDKEADRDVFYQYGVRSLPNLILVGPDGKEIRRYSPGIQSADSILSGIRAGSGR